jgi:hypothetical protein
MKVLVVDNKEILHKGEYEAEAVVIVFDWGYRIVTRDGGVQEYCTDLEKLLARPNVNERQLKAIRAWLDKQTNRARGEP